MNAERWQRIEELFRTVVECPADEREVYLTRVCGADEGLRQEVLSLLARDTAEDFLLAPIANVALSLTDETPDDLTGTRIGPYRLTRLVGHGGMGAVYEALRDDAEFQQKVAIKLIKRGMDSAFVRERFLRERQILASLDHPHIARLLDGGTTAGGQPYFVMEFVAGQPITEYCRHLELSLNEKLKLFRDVCAAVQHAHQKLVIHRDLKPANILVTEEGTPKLLDFGIAKLLSPDPGAAATRTEMAVRLMTPEYASPEQVRGNAMTTTTDVYSLGVVLYELLAERRPYQFETYSPVEIERAICDTEAPRPSEAAHQHPALAGGANTPAKLSRLLSGDLDNIVLMAMRKEADRRYQSVEQFSEDLRRYLSGLPITARPVTFGYRAGKFMRRHRAAVAAAVLVAFSLLGGIIATTYSARQARAERDRASQAAARAEAVTKSLVSVFEFADPGRAKGNAITAKELLDQGVEKVVRELNDQPTVQAKLMDTIGGLYETIGVYTSAQPLLEDALKLRRQTLGSEHIDVAESLHHLGVIAYEKGDYTRSEALFREALQLRRRLLGTGHLQTADSMHWLGRALITLGKFTEAEPLVSNTLALRRRLLPPEHKDIASSLLHGQGRLLGEQGKFAEAAENYREALSIHRKIFGAEHPWTAASMNNLAVMMQELGDYQNAEVLSRNALAMRRRLFGEEHPEVTGNMVNLASILRDKDEYEEAEQLYRQALLARRKMFGENHLRLAATMSNLATLLDAKGDYAAGEALQRQALSIQRKEFGEDHRSVGISLNNLASLLYHQGRYSEAEKLQRQAIAIYQKSLPPEHWLIQRSRSQLGACLFKLNHYREAEEQLLPAYAGLKATRGEQHEVTRETVSRLIELYGAWGKPDQVALYRALPKLK
jgi:tetratricopeptide (TPR) repeat protein/tRNA A-37 threonylcarbamoyl transferase component Bud32